MIFKVADYLGVSRESKAYQAAIDLRAQCDRFWKSYPLNARGQETAPFVVGESVLSLRGQPGVIESLNADGSCEIRFSHEGWSALVSYKSTGQAKKGARLRRLAPSMRCPVRAIREGQQKLRVGPVVRAFCETALARSPHQKDRMRRLLAPHVYEVTQALTATSNFHD